MSESGTEPNETFVASSASTGDDASFAYTATFSGTPFAASKASSAEPSRPPSWLGETLTVYDSCPPVFVGSAPETAQFCPSSVRNRVISSTDGASCFAPLTGVVLSCGSSSTYAVFDDASYTVTFLSLHTICASPTSDCNSSRPPFGLTHSRPVALEISADPAWPTIEPDGKSAFVKPMRAVIPSGFAPPSASWIACASGLGDGVGPLPPIAETAKAPRTTATTTAAASAARRRVD